MSLPVAYRQKVGRDLAAGFGYYEEQTEGLGEKFLAAVDSAFDAIERYPQRFAHVHGEVRRGNKNVGGHGLQKFHVLSLLHDRLH